MVNSIIILLPKVVTKAIGLAIPELPGKFSGSAQRVPVASLLK
jgi:Glyceraldehyde-3-phosphate dehydrogenase/erythrose-4-phosphate dehydrogenase